MKNNVSNINNLTIEQFNKLYPPGTEVKYYPVRSFKNEFILTTTTTPAWQLGHGAAVVGLAYGPGGYSFDNIEVLNDVK